MVRKLRGALEFVHHEASGGIMLLFAAVLALVLANSALATLYGALLDTPVTIRVGALEIDKNLLHWINDGLMAIFFFHVGLEIKRELIEGELSTLKQAALPAIGALGGMIVPALIYYAINREDPSALAGWAIPTATDIAFAVGVLALVGSRIPPSLKIFLLALAIIDDLGAILIIAIFYTSGLSLTALSLAAVGVLALAVLNSRGVTRTAAYVLVGIFVWLCVLKSGVHATLAGVVTAFAIPLTPLAGEGRLSKSESLASKLQESLHPWVNFGVLPAFAFANAGVSLAGLTLDKLMSPIPLGIALGLLVGKTVGVFSFTWLAIALGAGSRPEGSSWTQVFGVAVLAGIGFTMSLFIGMLAFPGPEKAADIRIGVLSGSVVAALVGYLILKYARPAPFLSGR
ncbi:Na+/H+ antiporter NhaA [Hyphomicrobium sp. LHD-15]|uniref:Na+/H+ antiporter NhaA n=1 Tax=Hyphomicrobium sp. LHD-15 TaxID=3072142 RepID=UPI00280F4649|nr:Na+/H+ antiporter NhaA [Hyphomicrobium sp. LHD-15]MDQ8698529.1 Na+/H+ antiporter NhaA [Hyphomicrobium sp. LHD-15]